MTKIEAYIRSVMCDGEMFNVIMLTHHSVYDFYLEPANGSFPLLPMFSLPVDEQLAEDAMDIALSNVPNYIDNFEED